MPARPTGATIPIFKLLEIAAVHNALYRHTNVGKHVTQISLRARCCDDSVEFSVLCFTGLRQLVEQLATELQHGHTLPRGHATRRRARGCCAG